MPYHQEDKINNRTTTIDQLVPFSFYNMLRFDNRRIWPPCSTQFKLHTGSRILVMRNWIFTVASWREFFSSPNLKLWSSASVHWLCDSQAMDALPQKVQPWWGSFPNVQEIRNSLLS